MESRVCSGMQEISSRACIQDVGIIQSLWISHWQSTRIFWVFPCDEQVLDGAEFVARLNALQGAQVGVRCGRPLTSAPPVSPHLSTQGCRSSGMTTVRLEAAGLLADGRTRVENRLQIIQPMSNCAFKAPPSACHLESDKPFDFFISEQRPSARAEIEPHPSSKAQGISEQFVTTNRRDCCQPLSIQVPSEGTSSQYGQQPPSLSHHGQTAC